MKTKEKSRQLRWQEKRRKAGCCIICGRLADGHSRCSSCMNKRRKVQSTNVLAHQ